MLRRTRGGSYITAELDGAIVRRPYAAFRLIPYFPRSHISIPVTKLVSLSDEELNMMTGEELDVGDPTDADDHASEAASDADKSEFET